MNSLSILNMLKYKTEDEATSFRIDGFSEKEFLNSMLQLKRCGWITLQLELVSIMRMRVAKVRMRADGIIEKEF